MGVTFVSSKILLDDYSPLEIMYMRFVLAYVGLWIIRPKHHPFRSFREESIFFNSWSNRSIWVFYVRKIRQ